MHTELWMIGPLWAISMLYADFISSIFEWMFAITVLILGVFYGLNHYLKRKNSINTHLAKQGFVNTMLANALSVIPSLAAAFIPLLSLFLFRSFILDISRVPTGSLKPTILIGDTILVKKYRYGVRLPFIGTPLLCARSPQRGDIVIFRLPQNRSKIFVKRMIGLPGDHIQYKQKSLTINGERVIQRVLGMVQDEETKGRHWTMLQSEEDLQGRKHAVYTRLDEPGRIANGITPFSHYKGEFSLIVPAGQYFVMGDNRDNSLDSRYWGFVPDNCLLGEASRVVFSWDKMASWVNPLTWVRWKRLGMKLV